MQTFLPDLDFARCARVLDDTRLSKQRIEAANILAALLGLRWSSSAKEYVKTELYQLPFSGHIAVRAWRGHEGSLGNYIQAMCLEFADRGFQEDVSARVADFLSEHIKPDRYHRPSWTNDLSVISSHRAVLLGKDRAHYSQFGWTEKPAVKDPITNRWPYVWPVSIGSSSH